MPSDFSGVKVYISFGSGEPGLYNTSDNLAAVLKKLDKLGCQRHSPGRNILRTLLCERLLQIRIVEAPKARLRPALKASSLPRCEPRRSRWIEWIFVRHGRELCA